MGVVMQPAHDAIARDDFVLSGTELCPVVLTEIKDGWLRGWSSSVSRSSIVLILTEYLWQ